MLTAFRRHLASCKHRGKGRTYRSCTCPISVEGTLHGEMIRKSLGVRNWDVGLKMMHEMELHGNKNVVSIGDVLARYIAQGESNGLSDATIGKYRVIKRELEAFFGDKSIRAITLDELSKYRESWKMSAISARKKIERLRSIYKFAIDRGWVDKNIASTLKLPKEVQIPVKPYDPDELEKIEWAIPLFPAKGIYREQNRERIAAFITVMRWTGLRIRDVVQLKRSAISEGYLTLRTQKNGKPVKLLLHKRVEKTLKALPQNGQYIFWSGEGNPKSCVGDWQRTLRRLADLSGVHVHAHRWRHTFAVTLLARGVPVSEVAAILGNSPRIVEKHYSQWIPQRQAALDSAMKKVWQPA